MRLSISNLAWDTQDDAAVAALLRQYGIDAIDIAPTKYFPDVTGATEAAIRSVRRWWQDHGIDIVGMQSLLYGTQGLNVFGDIQSQQALLEHLNHVCRIGAGLGASRLVFGSPRSRDRTGLSDAQAHDQAVAFFRQAGDVAARHGVMLCLEAVAPLYGANFMTTTLDCATVVRAVDHPALRMLLDTGAMQINGEDPQDMVPYTADITEHIHLAEPGLIPYGDGNADYISVRDSLVRHVPRCAAALEILPSKAEPALPAMARSLAFATALYRSADHCNRNTSSSEPAVNRASVQ